MSTRLARDADRDGCLLGAEEGAGDLHIELELSVRRHVSATGDDVAAGASVRKHRT